MSAGGGKNKEMEFNIKQFETLYMSKLLFLKFISASSEINQFLS